MKNVMQVKWTAAGVAMQTMGDHLGCLSYLGACAECRTQFMSRNDWAARWDGALICERCAEKIK